MVRTRGTSAFQQQFPLFHALIAGDSARVAALCTPQEAAKCGPGGLSVVMVALLLDLSNQLPPLIAAKAPLDAVLTLQYSDGELHKWLAAGHLTDRTVFRQQLVPGQTALRMAAELGKLEQAKLLVTAGAGLEPLLEQRSGVSGTTLPISEGLVPELRQHALSHHSGGGLAAAPAPVLGQLARLACEAGQADTGLAVLQAAVQRGVQLSPGDADALLVHAAAKGQVHVAMHVVKHSPHSVWGLLASFGASFRSRYATDRLHHSVAATLFAYLAEQLVSGELELENEERLELLIRTTLQAAQPATALVMLQATQNQDGAYRMEQQKEQPGQHRQRRQQMQRREQQQRLLLSNASLAKLLSVAAFEGHAAVVQYLLQQGTDVLPLLWDIRHYYGAMYEGRWDNSGIDPSVAPLLFSHLAQGYANGSLPVLSSRELEKVVKEAVEFSQPDACIRVLRTAAARQEEAISAAGAAAALREAAVFGQRSVVMHVAQNYGTRLLWPLFNPGTNTTSAVLHEVALYIAGQVSAGTVQLDSSRLGLLVSKAARHHDQEACAAILAAAAQQQVRLTSEDTSQSLHACLRAGCPADLVALLLRAGDALDSRESSFLARRAARYSLGTELEQLLQAGAVVDMALISATFESLSCSCLAALLRWGPLPVDTSKPTPGMDAWQPFDYRCPILQVMQKSKYLNYGDRRGLDMLELLLAAGHRPMVYQDMVLPPATQPVAVFDPLRDRPDDFITREGSGWWLWLALEPEGWSPASHHKHPPLLKSAFRTVLLAAAHGRSGSAAKMASPAQAPHKRQRLEMAEALAGEHESGPSSAAYLSMLPSELLLHVLHLAARPLGAWLEAQ